MISDMEIALLTALGERLQVAESSDNVREGRALQALLEAHDELKKPHVQALAQPTLLVDAERVIQLKSVAANLDAAVESAEANNYPSETHKEALKAAARAASAALRQIVATAP
jgi:hypothetical protein